MQPNVILIIADQWRGDCLGAMGHPDVLTPNFDDMCGSGYAFRNGYSATPTCIPARAALLTGMKQENHRRVGYQDGVPWDYENTIAAEFTKAGYQTQCCGKMHVHPERRSMGYQAIDLHDGYLHYYRKPGTEYFTNQKIADDYYHWLRCELGVEADPTEMGLDCNSFTARPWMYAEKYHPTRWVTDKAIDFLRRRDRDKPFFLTLSYVRPHAPFDAPQHFFDMYRRPLTPPLKGDWDDNERLRREGYRMTGYTGPADDKLIEEMRRGYYACITQIDYEFGRFREALFTHGLDASNTIIMFVSDHGDMLGDHALSRKSLPYRGSASVPFVVECSREFIERAGGTCGNTERLVELMDVMPTLLSLAGVEVPDTVDGQNVFAKDFSREYLHGEHLWMNCSCQWIVTAKDKYVWFSDTGAEQYFDIENDPDETHNAVFDEDKQERVSEMRSILINELKWREEGFVQEERLVPGRTVKAVLSRSRRESE